MSTSAVPRCPACASPRAAWQVDSPVRASDRVVIEPGGLRLLGLHVPDEGLEPVDRPDIRCLDCGAELDDAVTRDAVLAAATAAARGETPRSDA